jgi:hypothetical protein
VSANVCNRSAASLVSEDFSLIPKGSTVFATLSYRLLGFDEPAPAKARPLSTNSSLDASCPPPGVRREGVHFLPERRAFARLGRDRIKLNRWIGIRRDAGKPS